MGKLIEITIYVMFGGLVCYKMLNDFISERLEATIKFILYSLITIYLILKDIQANIIWVVLIGAILFVPAMINNDEEDRDSLSYAIEILLCSVNIFIILIKFGVMRLLFNI